MEAIRGLLQHAVRRGVPMLTLYAFSRENWARSDDEVAGLFDLLGRAIANETDELRAQGVRVRLLGRLEELPDETRSSIAGALDRTAEGTPARTSTSPGTTPAGRSWWTRSAGSPPPASRPTRSTSARSATRSTRAACPIPTCVIRTGGEQRISNFLIWQSAYAELVFTECLWPDFGADAFDAALLEFARRTRRFGR